MKASDVCKRTGICVDGLTEEDRWLIANPYLPGDRRSFSMIYGVACSTDGTLYVAANGVVSAEGTRRRPRSNGDWYAGNGPGKQALFNHPQGLALDRDGNCLTDWVGAVNRHGASTDDKDIDGRPPKTRVRRPGALCVTGDGTLFLAPAAPRRGPIRKVDSKTREVSTWVY